MQLQIALDRLSLEQALQIAISTQNYTTWIEIGTSLIKEFGIESVRCMRQTLTHTSLLADIKTNDNARYEFELCFKAGADAATVMGTSPDATIQTCVSVAQQFGKQVMIDLLATSPERQRELLKYRDAIFGVHVSKDVQESGAAKGSLAARLPAWASDYQIALAGGISLDDIPELGARVPGLTVIVGSAITQAHDSIAAAQAFAAALEPYQHLKGRV